MVPQKGLAMTESSVPVTIESWLESKRDELFGLLPSNIHKERFLRNIIMQIKMNENLKNCSITSIAKACVQASTLGLDIGVLGSAYLVPYGNEAQLSVGYQGYIDLAYRSGMKALHTGIVRELDSYKATHEDFTHEYDPFGTEEERGPVVGVYALVVLPTGTAYSELMSVSEIDQIRRGSRSANSPAWRDHWGEMAKKVVIRRALKRAPMSTETKEIIQISDNAEFGFNTPSKPLGKEGLRESLETTRPAIETVNTKLDSVWSQHREKANQLADTLNVSRWNKINRTRQAMLIQRMKEQSYTIDQVEEFWTETLDIFASFDKEKYLELEEKPTLEDYLRLPRNGSTDYYAEATREIKTTKE